DRVPHWIITRRKSSSSCREGFRWSEGGLLLFGGEPGNRLRLRQISRRQSIRRRDWEIPIRGPEQGEAFAQLAHLAEPFTRREGPLSSFQDPHLPAPAPDNSCFL